MSDFPCFFLTGFMPHKTRPEGFRDKRGQEALSEKHNETPGSPALAESFTTQARSTAARSLRCFTAPEK
jgi:hypothetical protein